MQNTPLKLVPLLAMLAAAAAQVTPPSPTLPAQDGRVPIHSHQGGDDPDYGVWAAMPGYKVSFHAGFAFYPLLGDAYPENLPLRWQATALTAGGQAIAVPTGAVQRRSDWRFEYDHGAFREVYDVR